MISTWRERRAGRRANKKITNGNRSLEVAIPTHFRCPISLDLMKDPVTLPTGITYDRESIETWVEAGNKICPVTNQVLGNFEQIPNHSLRRMIQDWCVDNRSNGIERIPTPRVPVTPFEVSEILSSIITSTQCRDESGCLDLVVKIKNLAKESERNKRCIVANGTSSVLSTAFNTFADLSFEKHTVVLAEILSTLTRMFPLDAEAQLHLGSQASLRCMLWLLNCGDISARRNAVLLLKEILSSNERHVDALAEIKEVFELLFKLIKEPICLTTTKASLTIIYYLISSSPSGDEIKSRFAEMGLVSLLIEILVESERSLCEKALAVFDAICSCKEGREQAYNHALTMPVLVKKLLRVSELATEFAVSALWKLCKKEEREEGGVLVEALQVGSFQKLLLVLQIGCDERTKEKATELLKLLNLHRARSECIESVDFKELERPF